MAKEKTKEVEKMIGKVMAKKDLTRDQAVDYMLGVATGRLAALWRYDDSVPEGKSNKGILVVGGRKKRAPKSPRISVLPTAEISEDAKPKRAKKSEPKPKKRGKSKQRKAKTSEPAVEIAETVE